MNPSVRGVACVIADNFLLLVIFLTALSQSLPATAQVYCYNPLRKECYISRDGFCPRYESIPITRGQCMEIEGGNRPVSSTVERCCYNAATGQAYRTRSECGVMEQTINLDTCRVWEEKRPWCLPFGQSMAFQSNTNTCPDGTMTLSDEESKPFR
jgi:hypothetical protein